MLDDIQVVVSEQRKAALIDKHRECEVDDFWYEGAYEVTKCALAHRGIAVDRFAFSGFWSQGDGASFTGTVNPLVLAAKDFDTTYPMLATLVSKGETFGNINITTSGQYSHSNTMDFEWRENNDSELLVQTLTTNELTEAVADADNWVTKIDAELVALMDFTEVECRSLADTFYEDLEKEYEYLTSDEQVWESLISNDYFGEDLED